MYTAQQVELILEQFHTMMIEFMHNGQALKYEDICKEIGYTPIEIEYPEPNEPEHTLGELGD